MKRSNRAVVALVTDAIFPYHCGGKELRYYELVKRLESRADVHVYTMNWWGGPRSITRDSVTFHAVCRYHPLYSAGRRSIAQGIFFAVGCLRLLTCRFDVLEADHMPYIQIPVLRLIATLRRKPLVVTWHEVWGRAYWREYLGWAGLIAWFFEWLSMRLPDHIIAASPQTAERIRAATRNRARLTVAPNGIDLEAIEHADAQGEPVDVVVVGRLMPHKRVGMLLSAIKILQDAGESVTCRVIGDGPERQTLKAQAARLGLAGVVEFRHDVQDQKELYGLMRAARAFAFPSAREGFGIAALEAIACGLPVVTTSAPDNLARHLVERSVRGVVCESSPEAIAAALHRVLSAADSADLLHARSDTWLADYTWDATAATVAGALRI